MGMDGVRAEIRRVVARHAAQPEMVRGLCVPYQRRGEMSIPAFRMKAGEDPEKQGRETSLRMMRKAATLPVDFFFFDCEDAAPDQPEFKAHARAFAVEVLKTTDFGTRVVGFRPNNIRTAHFEEDLLHAVGEAGDRIHALVLPKSETADEVRDVARLVRDIQRLRGRDNTISLEVLIESPRAFLEAEQMAAIPNVTALILGSWDFARTVGGRVEAETWLDDQLAVRQLLPVLAAAHGKDAVDAITGTLPLRPSPPAGVSTEETAAALDADPATLDVKKWGQAFVDGAARRRHALGLARRDAENARRLGFAAKWILHPDQIGPVQGAWTPDRAAALGALKLAADYTRAALGGSGAELRGQQLTDKAVVGAEWWLVEAGLRAAVLTDDDVKTSGFTLAELRRTVRTRD
jgi:citrate lyase beta subunit